jgi:hypothetical protein
LLSSELNSLDNEIVLFPNPANDFINVKGMAQKEYSFKILDFNSKIVLQVKITESQNIDVSKLSSGVYFYEVIDLNQNRSKGKFIKN